MELTYQSPMMPAAYTAISSDEMTYIDGGAIQVGSYLIEFHPEVLLDYCIGLSVNIGQLLGRAALTAAIGGLVAMHEDGLSLSQSVSYYWDGQTKAGKIGTIVVGGFASWYGFLKAVQMYNTVKSMYIEFKNAYAQTKAQNAAQQDVGITDPIVAAA